MAHETEFLNSFVTETTQSPFHHNSMLIFLTNFHEEINFTSIKVIYQKSIDIPSLHTGPDCNGLVQKLFLGFFYYKETSNGQKYNIPVFS